MKHVKHHYKLLLVVSASLVLFILSITIPQTGAYLKERKRENSVTQISDLTLSVLDSGAVDLDQWIKEESSYRSVRIKNEALEPLFVRVSVQPSLKNKDKQYKPVNMNELIPTIHIDWLDGEDGYYYYTKKIGKEQESAALFSQLKALKELEKDDTFELSIKAEGITTYETSYRDAWWQGEEPDKETQVALSKVDKSLYSIRDTAKKSSVDGHD